jgi:hypothetical protein
MVHITYETHEYDRPGLDTESNALVFSLGMKAESIRTTDDVVPVNLYVWLTHELDVAPKNQELTLARDRLSH